ncbi:hypothetical protein HBI37_039520 [Parastagonospora nodorum]|nr:hypothetical protein HBI37_039520 [Parastagonospora nodorum]KAH6356002.1 hypothetical protein HBI36_084730 [Parastagonospora nodorum]
MVSTLAELPVELLNVIIHELPNIGPTNAKYRDDLMNLRLVCQTIETKTRRRFLREFCRGVKIDVPYREVKEDGEYYPDMYDNPEFQEFVQAYTICLAQLDLSPEDVGAWTHFTEFIMDDSLKGEFDRHLKHCANLETLHLCGPPLPSGISLELQEKINLAWQKAFRDILTTAFSDEGLRLKVLMLGVGGPQALPIPTYMFQGIPKTSKFLSKLDKLTLATIIDEDALEPVQHPSTGDATRTFDDFLALAPKVRFLEYRGGLGDPLVSKYPGLDSLPRNLLPRWALTKIVLSGLAISETLLAENLLTLSATLKEIGLRNINLTSGTWIPLLRMMRANLQLTYLTIEDLYQEDRRLGLYLVNKERPLIIDSETARARDDDWNCAVAKLSCTRGPPDDAYKAAEAELEELLADDWVWLLRDFYNEYRITLDAEEGDDVTAWVSSIEHVHELWRF